MHVFHRDEDRDRAMVRNVLRFHRCMGNPRLDVGNNLFLRYLAYCRSCIDPLIGKEAAEVLQGAVSLATDCKTSFINAAHLLPGNEKAR